MDVQGSTKILPQMDTKWTKVDTKLIWVCVAIAFVFVLLIFDTLAARKLMRFSMPEQRLTATGNRIMGHEARVFSVFARYFEYDTTKDALVMECVSDPQSKKLSESVGRTNDGFMSDITCVIGKYAFVISTKSVTNDTITFDLKKIPDNFFVVFFTQLTAYSHLSDVFVKDMQGKQIHLVTFAL